MGREMIVSGRNTHRKGGGWSKSWNGLQFSMAVSYIGVTIVTILLLEIVLSVSILLMITHPSFVDSDTVRDAKHKAQIFALEAAVQAATGTKLPPGITFQPGQRASISLSTEGKDKDNVPYIAHDTKKPPVVALLITPDAHVLASSYPSHYPLNAVVDQLLPTQQAMLHAALAGTAKSATVNTAQGRVTYAAMPIENREKKILGVAYVQIPTDKPTGFILLGFASEWLISGIILLIALTPMGAIFGVITTRTLVRRIHNLVKATASMADGDYTQRIKTTKHDEVGQLERQFNMMAQRLAASIASQKILTEQNARLEERTRIARDLHDSVKQQVFALSMQLGAARSLLDQKREAARQHLLEADTLAYEVRQELTTWIQELRPLVFREKDFAAAVREYAMTWSRQNSIEIDLHVSDDNAHLSLPITNTLARIMQEALSNVARHSKASKVKIILVETQKTLQLVITDDGCGFDMVQVKTSSVGLQSMRERMAELDGSVTIQSIIGGGTTILAQCPIESPISNK